MQIENTLMCSYYLNNTPFPHCPRYAMLLRVYYKKAGCHIGGRGEKPCKCERQTDQSKASVHQHHRSTDVTEQ